MPIHPWLAEKFDVLRDVPSFAAAVSDPQYAARFGSFIQDPAPWEPPAGVSTLDLVVPGPHGDVPVRVFAPTEGGRHPALLWLHGGAFVSGSVDHPESFIPGFELAARASAVVVSVEYRLAVGGTRFPIPLDDVVAAWEWLTAHTAEHGIDPGRLFIGGASAGGNLATAATMRLRDAGGIVPSGLLLAYPLVHFPVPPVTQEQARDLEQLPAMLRFTPQDHIDTIRNYLGRITDVPAGIAPGNFPLHGMPETWIAPDEFDDLRPSSELFVQQLEESGVPVHVELAEGVMHGHLSRTPSLAPVDRTLDFFAAALSAARG